MQPQRRSNQSDRGMHRRGNQRCYMCEALATSREHVPPKCLFPARNAIGAGLRINLVTVPSCDRHNSQKSADDEFLRVILAFAAAGTSDVATYQFSSKVLRAAKREPRAYQSFVRDVDIAGPPGKRVLATDRERFDRCIDHIARALYFHTYNSKLLAPIVVVSPTFMMRSDASRLAPHTPTVSAVEITRLYLAGERNRGENPEVFLYRIRREDTMFAFGACFYEYFEVFAASSPTLSANVG